MKKVLWQQKITNYTFTKHSDQLTPEAFQLYNKESRKYKLFSVVYHKGRVLTKVTTGRISSKTLIGSRWTIAKWPNLQLDEFWTQKAEIRSHFFSSIKDQTFARKHILRCYVLSKTMYLLGQLQSLYFSIKDQTFAKNILVLILSCQKLCSF